jgi:iron complex outermembrane receptor protein
LRSLIAVVAACAAGALAAPAPAGEAGADTSELESLLTVPVYAASKYQQSALEAPAAVTVITQGEIRAFGWRTLAEVLNAVRGVHARYDRAYSYVGVRGLGRPGDYSSRLLILVDGVRLNDNIYDSVLTGREFPLDIELIDRIEFIPGPGSAVHGSNAVLGTINLVTRSAAGLRGRQAMGAFDTQQGWKLGASASTEHAAGSLLVAASAEIRPGQTLAFPEYDSPATPGGIVRGQDAESAARLFLRFESGDWSVAALGGRRAKEIPNAPFGLVFADPAAEWVDKLGLLSFSWHPAAEDGEGWYAQFGLGRYEYGDHGRYEPDALLARYTNVGVWANGELNHTLRLGERHLLLAGLAMQRDLRQEVSEYLLEPVPEAPTTLATDGTRLGLYVSDDITLTARWRLGVGARLDRDVHESWKATPRASLLWRPHESLVLKAIAGEAYRDPNVYERVPLGPSSGWNDELRRERTSAREIAADWQPSAALRLSASAFRYRVTDMIEQVTDPDSDELVYANVSSARARGVELEADLHAPGGLRVRSSVTRQRATNDAGELLSNSPRWLAKLHATAPVPATPLRAALELQGMGRRRTETGDTLPAQLLTNLSLGWNPPGRRWSASLTIHNLFDRKVADPTSGEYLADRVAQDGRTGALRLYVTF